MTMSDDKIAKLAKAYEAASDVEKARFQAELAIVFDRWKLISDFETKNEAHQQALEKALADADPKEVAKFDADMRAYRFDQWRKERAETKAFHAIGEQHPDLDGIATLFLSQMPASVRARLTLDGKPLP